MLFGLFNYILCGVKHTRGHGVNIIDMAGLNCVGLLSVTDVSVGGGNDGRDVYIF